ncbi:hypothetical protein MMC34_001134 [Xylographa carneopallida]|nr:hypothetical protein [Xylographa carneopallida]
MYEVRIEIEREKIAKADVLAADRYRVDVTELRLGTKWWASRLLKDLQGIRFRERRGSMGEAAEDEEWQMKRRRGGTIRADTLFREDPQSSAWSWRRARPSSKSDEARRYTEK